MECSFPNKVNYLKHLTLKRSTASPLADPETRGEPYPALALVSTHDKYGVDQPIKILEF